MEVTQKFVVVQTTPTAPTPPTTSSTKTPVDVGARVTSRPRQVVPCTSLSAVIRRVPFKMMVDSSKARDVNLQQETKMLGSILSWLTTRDPP